MLLFCRIDVKWMFVIAHFNIMLFFRIEQVILKYACWPQLQHAVRINFHIFTCTFLKTHFLSFLQMLRFSLKYWLDKVMISYENSLPLQCYSEVVKNKVVITNFDSFIYLFIHYLAGYLYCALKAEIRRD